MGFFSDGASNANIVTGVRVEGRAARGEGGILPSVFGTLVMDSTADAGLPVLQAGDAMGRPLERMDPSAHRSSAPTSSSRTYGEVISSEDSVNQNHINTYRPFESTHRDGSGYGIGGGRKYKDVVDHGITTSYTVPIIGGRQSMYMQSSHDVAKPLPFAPMALAFPIATAWTSAQRSDARKRTKAERWLEEQESKRKK